MARSSGQKGNSNGVTQMKNIAMQGLACGGSVERHTKEMRDGGFVPTSQDYKKSGGSFHGYKKGGCK